MLLISPILSLCIPTYNRSLQLKNCLLSILSNTFLSDLKSIEIIISDNSDDIAHSSFTKALLATLPFLQLDVHYIHNTTNIGFTRNLISVVSQANGRFIWIVGDDDKFVNNSISHVVSLIQSQSEIEYIFSPARQVNHLPTLELIDQTDFLSRLIQRFFLPKTLVSFSYFLRPGFTPDLLGPLYVSIISRDLWLQGLIRFLASFPDIKTQATFSSAESTYPHAFVLYEALSHNSMASSLPFAGIHASIEFRDWAYRFRFFRIFYHPQMVLYAKQNKLISLTGLIVWFLYIYRSLPLDLIAYLRYSGSTFLRRHAFRLLLTLILISFLAILISHALF